ncbi:MAG: hypothetical protein INR69_15810 [Mucilaginibacter polytrichastri]|nr:hypothetical protein [Mucilaginibacter polytrichastri]
MIYTERQRFDQLWLIVLFCSETAVMLAFGLYKAVKEADFTLLFIVPVPLLFYFLLNRLLWLDVRVDAAGIYYRFAIFGRRLIGWNELSAVFIRRYDPLSEYGGWGYKKGWKRKNRVINVKGDMGLQLVFHNGNRLLIGTSQPRELKMFLVNLAHSQHGTIPLRTEVIHAG